MKYLFSSILSAVLVLNFFVVSAQDVIKPVLAQEDNKKAAPLITPEQQQKAKQAASAPLAATFEKRKELILKGISKAFETLSKAEKNVQNSQSLSQEQKQELLKIINQVEDTLTTYQKSVQAAQDSDDLMAANKAFIVKLKEDKQKIRASIATVMMIGVEEVLDTAQTYLTVAEEAANALAVCNVDTSDIQKQIDEANTVLADLEKLVNSIMADGKITEDEYDDVKKAAKMAAELSKMIAEITADLTEAAEQCPYLSEGE